MSKTMVEQNRDTAFAVVKELVGGDVVAYFESTSTVAAVWMECLNNAEIQRLTTNYVWGSFAKADQNLKLLEAKLREVFGLVA